MKSYKKLRYPHRGPFWYKAQKCNEMQFIFNNFDIEILQHNYVEISEGYIVKPKLPHDISHSTSSVHFLIEGAVEYRKGENKIEISSGSVFLTNDSIPASDSYVYTENSREMTLTVNMYLGNFDDPLSKINVPLIFTDRESCKKIGQLFLSPDYTSIFEIKSLCITAVARFIQLAGLNLHEHILLARKYSKAYEYIKNNLSMNLRIEDVAETTNFSNKYFSKCFAEDNKVTIREYIHDRILNEVEQLLINTNMPLAKIAEKYDFCEPTYFTRWFKKRKGITPLQFRKNLGKYIEPLDVQE